jgi:hypothetical protein
MDALRTLKYEEYNDVWHQVQDDWDKAEVNRHPVVDWANRTQKVFEDARSGRKGLG